MSEIESVFADFNKRIRQLEANPLGRLGQCVEFQGVPSVALHANGYIDLTAAYNIIDPLGFYDPGVSETEIVIPAGLGGLYHVSWSFRIEAE